jgi:hypothetical protein
MATRVIGLHPDDGAGVEIAVATRVGILVEVGGTRVVGAGDGRGRRVGTAVGDDRCVGRVTTVADGRDVAAAVAVAVGGSGVAVGKT